LDFNGFYSLLILYEIAPFTFETDSTLWWLFVFCYIR
jgi:hypothetical protein